MTPSPRCVAIVVSYNSSADLPECLAALGNQRDVDLEIHVVDNASVDGSPELVRSRFPSVHLTANRENVGFGRANNQILEGVEAEYFALVNPDAITSDRAIATCIEYMEENQDVGISATRLVYPDGTLHPSTHAYLGFWNLVGETFLLDRLFPRWPTIASLNMTGFDHDSIAEVDWIQGAFLVVRGKVCRDIGGFDPEFFVNGEEMEWSYRIQKSGWRIVFLPEPTVVHKSGTSTRPVAGPMFVENLKGRIRFLEKHRGPLVTFGARLVIGAAVLLRAGAREAMAAGTRLMGRQIPEPLRMRQEIFRSATGWVLRGQPLDSPHEKRRSG